MRLTRKQEAKLARMRGRLKTTGLWAAWWITSAGTGAATTRVVIKGDGSRLTSEELTKEALDTAASHIHNIDKIANNIALLLEGRENEIE